MIITSTVIKKIRQIVRFFETSKVEGADYGAMAIFNDGPGGRPQLTYGASQTTEYGNLKTLVKMYIDARGKYWAELNSFYSHLGDLQRSTLAYNETFVNLLKKASLDPIMQATQDRFFNIYYFAPARQWFEKAGMKLPLSLLVIYDSEVHSGGILPFLRNRFPARVPADGGDEKTWITQYVNTRDEWLENHKRKILRKTDYRTDSFIYAIEQDNWMLDKPFTVVYTTKTTKMRKVAVIP